MFEKIERSSGVLEAGQKVIQAQAQALERLASSLSQDFGDMVWGLHGTKGKIIVSGMGKSGHIGRKIAATLASTGSPAFFLHPAEACHGDLGVIGPEDCLLIISNSGQTAELMISRFMP